MSNLHAHRYIMIVFLGGLAAIAPFCVDTYLPAFGAIAKGIGTTVPKVSFSLTSYFLGICLGQLAHGPILDRFGRRKPLLCGMAIMTVASMGCALASSIEALIAWRFLQAVSGCVGMVAGRALVMDLFPKDATQIFSTLMLVMGLSMVLAPTFGGWISVWFGWRAIFYLHTALALVLAATCFRLLPCDRKNDQGISLSPRSLFSRYGNLFANRTFRTYSVAGNWVSAGLLGYIAGAPFVYMKLFGLTETQYAWAAGINSIAYVLGSQLNLLLIKRWAPETIARGSLVSQLAISAVLAIAGGWLGLGPWPCMIILWVCLITHGLATPNAISLALAPFRERAGTAAAMNGAMTMALSAVASAAVATFHNGTLQPMALTLTACALLGLVFVSMDRKNSVPAIPARTGQKS